jgi:hypothetical protein
MFKMTDGEINPILQRMIQKKWIVMQDNYLQPIHAGDQHINKIRGWMSMAIYNIRNQIPLYEWKDSKKLSNF